MFNSKIDPIVHQRYQTATTVRAVIHRINPSPSKPITNYVESHGLTFHRMREIDIRIELGTSDTEAPFLIGHHIHNGVRGARAHLNEWDWNVKFIRGRKTAYHLATAWISLTLDARILPAMYAAKLEIDPNGVYEHEYIEFRDKTLAACSKIHTRFNNHSVKRTKKIKDLESQLLKEELEKFVVRLEEWQTRAIADLAPPFMEERE